MEKKSFSHAAQELHLTQPAVTTQIRNLEKYYGIKLLQRDNKTVVPTPAGIKLYHYAQQIIALYHQARAELETLGGILRGHLRIGATYTIAEYILPQVVGFFKNELPQAEIAIFLGNRDEVCRSILEDESDIAIIAGDCQNRNFVCDHWLTDNLVIIVNSDHPWAERGSITPAEVYEERFILREVGSSSRQLWESALREAGFDPEKLDVFLELNSHEAIKKWVELNFGVAVLSEWVVAREVRLKTLAKVNIQGLCLNRNINLIHPRDLRHPLAEQFLRFCRTNKKRFGSMINEID
ncbi:MAG: hypothetical protein PWQ18_34 [Clostridia bacterium]|nr:hypothetical protein [Clostridia bacterium]